MTFFEFALAMAPAGIVLMHQIFQNIHNNERFRTNNEYLSNMARILFEHAKAQDAVIHNLQKKVKELTK